MFTQCDVTTGFSHTQPTVFCLEGPGDRSDAQGVTLRPVPTDRETTDRVPYRVSSTRVPVLDREIREVWSRHRMGTKRSVLYGVCGQEWKEGLRTSNLSSPSVSLNYPNGIRPIVCGKDFRPPVL